MQAIVAVSENWGIGRDNALLFHISADLKRFKALTAGHTVIMGRKTLQSLPGGRGLPQRRNIVLTRDASFHAERAETIVTTSLEYLPLAPLFKKLATVQVKDAVCIGGASVYRQLLPYCDRVYVTKVLAAPEADAFFPNLDHDPAWRAVEASEVMEENGLRFQYITYEKSGR